MDLGVRARHEVDAAAGLMISRVPNRARRSFFWLCSRCASRVRQRRGTTTIRDGAAERHGAFHDSSPQVALLLRAPGASGCRDSTPYEPSPPRSFPQIPETSPEASRREVPEPVSSLPYCLCTGADRWSRAQCCPPIAVSIGAIVVSEAGMELSGAGVLDGVDSVDRLAARNLRRPAPASAARRATMLRATYFRILCFTSSRSRRTGLPGGGAHFSSESIEAKNTTWGAVSPVSRPPCSREGSFFRASAPPHLNTGPGGHGQTRRKS